MVNRGVDIGDGEIIVPVDYEDIQWGYMDIKENKTSEVVWFQCKKTDGTFDVYYEKNNIEEEVADAYYE